MPTTTITASQVSQPVAVGAGSIVTVTPGSGATATVEYTGGSRADIANGVAVWSAWAKGAVSAATKDYCADSVFLRVTAVGGSVSLDVNGAPSAADLAALSNDWGVGGVQFAYDAFSNLQGLQGPGGVIGSSIAYSRTGQIAWGSYGDSIANVSAYANFDIRQINAGAYGATFERMGAWIGPLSNGLLRQVANCGKSGDTTSQMVTREADATPTATRKNILDAVTTGTYFLVNSMGINDMQTLAGGASQATIDGVVNTAVANAIKLLKKQRANGIYPITHSLLGYNLTTATASEIATRQAASKQFNALLGAAVKSAGNELGSWVDVYALVTDAIGNWLPGVDQGDGLHPGANGCKIIYSKVVAEMLRVCGLYSAPKYAYPQGANLIPNSDFSASSSGQATGLTIYVANGTANLAKTIFDFRGQNWQEIVVTPTALDGSGNCILDIDIPYASAGVASGDVIGGELSLYIDDGAGNAPAICSFGVRLRANTNYADTPQNSGTQLPKVYMSSVVDEHIGMLPIVSPAATPATALITVLVTTGQLTPFRVRIALPRALKLAAAY